MENPEQQGTTIAAENAPEISARKRLLLWAGAWFAAAFATTVPAFGLVMFWWWFPIGLAGVFVPSGWEGAPYIYPIPGWLLYLGLSIYGLSCWKRGRFFLIYAILIVLLILNAVGCRVELAHFSWGT